MPCSARFTANHLFVESGSYWFKVRMLEYGGLYVDDKLLIDNWDGKGFERGDVFANVNLSAGYHKIRMDYRSVNLNYIIYDMGMNNP